MKKKNLLLLGVACGAAAVFAAQVRGNAAEEVKRLAALMEWKPGTIAADIGAGDGRDTFAAGGARGGCGERVLRGGPSEKAGRVWGGVGVPRAGARELGG